MNNLEREVLGILSEDCRLDAEKIAVMLGATAEEVQETVRCLEKRGVLVKYAAITNLDEEED